MRGSRLLPVVLATSLGACTVGPDFERPDPALPSRFDAPAASRDRASAPGNGETEWWRTFRDPKLVSLVERLLSQNLDVQIAAERVLQAQAMERVAASKGLPQVSGTGDYDRIRTSKNGLVSLVQPSPKSRPEFNYYSLGGQLSWEVDLFGRIRRQVEARRAETKATIEDRRGVALSSAAELADDYMQLRLQQTRIALLLEDAASLRQRVDLFRQRLARGAASRVDVDRAAAELTRIEQNLPSARAEAERLGNAIALLLGAEPGALRRELSAEAPRQPPAPGIEAGVPSDLLRRRPDIRAVEARLHAAIAETGVATASFFPSLTLSAVANFNSLVAGKLFDWISRSFIAGPRAKVPIFKGGQLTGYLELRRSEQREALLAYNQTVLTALHETSDALTLNAEAEARRGDAAALVAADAQVVALVERRYRDGAADLIEVSETRRGLLAARNDEANAIEMAEAAAIQLYKALGGGWRTLPPVDDRTSLPGRSLFDDAARAPSSPGSATAAARTGHPD